MPTAARWWYTRPQTTSRPTPPATAAPESPAASSSGQGARPDRERAAATERLKRAEPELDWSLLAPAGRVGLGCAHLRRPDAFSTSPPGGDMSYWAVTIGVMLLATGCVDALQPRPGAATAE